MKVAFQKQRPSKFPTIRPSFFKRSCILSWVWELLEKIIAKWPLSYRAVFAFTDLRLPNWPAASLSIAQETLSAAHPATADATLVWHWRESLCELTENDKKGKVLIVPPVEFSFSLKLLNQMVLLHHVIQKLEKVNWSTYEQMVIGRPTKNQTQ